MTNYQMLEALNAAMDKDTYGGSFTPEVYSHIASEVNISFLKRKMEDLYQKVPSQNIQQTIFSSKLFAPLIVRDTVTPSSGVINVATGLTKVYAFWVSMRGVHNGQYKKIELIDQDDAINRHMNICAKPISIYPIAEMDGAFIRIVPTNVTSVIFYYIQLPPAPVFDYYLNEYNEIVYLPASTTNVVVPENAIYSTGVAGPVNVIPKTVEWAYPETFHSEIFTEMQSFMSQRIKDQSGVALAENRMNKQDAV